MKNEVNDTNVNNSVTPEVPVNNVSNETPSMPEMQPNVAPNMNASVAPAGVAPKASFVAGLKSGLTIGGVHLSLQALIAIAVAVVLIVAGVIVKVVTSTPKAVFQGVVNNAYKEIHKTLKEYDKLNEKFSFSDGVLYASADMSIDSNFEEVVEIEDEYGISLKDYKIKGEMGVNAKDKKFLVGAGIEGNDVSLDAKLFVEDNKIYLSTSVYDDVILFDGDEADIDFSDFEEVFDTLSEAEEKVDTKDLDYLAKSLKNAINKSLDSEALSKESDEIDVDGKDIKVTKYTYEIDDKVLANMAEIIAEELLEDDEFIKILADMSETDKSDLKDALKELKKSAKDIEFEGEIKINLFTKGLFNSYAGLSIEVMGEEIVEIYTDGKTAEMTMGVEGEEIVVVAKEEKKQTTIEVEYNKTKVAELTVRSATEELIDFDYEIINPEDEEEKIEGLIYLACKENKDSISGDYKFEIEYDGEYVKVSGSYNISTKNGVDMDTDGAVSSSEVDPDEIVESATEELGNDEGLATLVEDLIEQAEEEAIQEQLNYNGMIEVTTEEAVELLTKKKATVLYVGTYSYTDPYFDFWYDLEDLQDELGFYSYYLNTKYNSVSEVITAAGEVPYSCVLAPAVETPAEGTEAAPATDTTTCEETPIIYLIKDGKVVKGLRIGTTQEEMEAALAEIGIE